MTKLHAQYLSKRVYRFREKIRTDLPLPRLRGHASADSTDSNTPRGHRPRGKLIVPNHNKVAWKISNGLCEKIRTDLPLPRLLRGQHR